MISEEGWRSLVENLTDGPPEFELNNDDDALPIVVAENPEIITMAEALAQAKIDRCPF